MIPITDKMMKSRSGSKSSPRDSASNKRTGEPNKRRVKKVNKQKDKW